MGCDSSANGFSCSFQGDPGEDGRPVSLRFSLSRVLSLASVSDPQASAPHSTLSKVKGFRDGAIVKMQFHFC